MPELYKIIDFNIALTTKRARFKDERVFKKTELVNANKLANSEKKLPITVLIITWDVGHNPLGRSYMLAEVVQRIARHALLVGFQFPRYGSTTWEPVRDARIPVITLPGANLPEFYDSLQSIAARIKPDVVIACKPRLPSIALGMMIKEKWGCPLIIDIDDHELSFFNNKEELSIDQLEAMSAGIACKEIEPYSEFWTRLSQSLSRSADEIIVSNVALQKVFGGSIISHVRDENIFDPEKYDKKEVRRRLKVPIEAKIIMFFGTPRIHKGLDKLARAVNLINNPDYRLLIVGTAPDRSVFSKLEALAPGRLIFLPNQPFESIPEILAMADLVCLPQDEEHPVSRYQLPAKAIDAIAMGVPLLVSDTPPLLQLVKDQVATLFNIDDLAGELERTGEQQKDNIWRSNARIKFLERYSYSAAAKQLRDVIKNCLNRKTNSSGISITRLRKATHHVLGIDLEYPPKSHKSGIDVVVFWKQNDTGLYGRRHDMVIKWLASRPEVRKVIVFDAPISEFDLIKFQHSDTVANQNRWIYKGTYEKLLGVQDSEKISHNVYVYPPGKYQSHISHVDRPHLNEGYLPYVTEVLMREGVAAEKSLFWIYPKNNAAPDLIKLFQPKRVVVDVVDDHRTWPGISETEKNRLTQNYKDILSHAYMAFANCTSVQESMREFFPTIRMIPNGCDSSPPKGIPKNSIEFDNYIKWSGKIIGYIGNLESKINIELLEKIALKFKDCLLALIGSTHTNPDILKLRKYSNIRMPGVVPYEQIGAWVSRFNVGILPHRNTELTKNMNPLKFFVYMANGIPVVSTFIDNIDVNAYGLMLSRNDNQFLDNLEKCLFANNFDSVLIRNYAATNDWKARFESVACELLSSND